MSYRTRLHIRLIHGHDWQVTINQRALKLSKGLPSGSAYTLDRAISDVQKERIIIRPYYRRFIKGELHIFSVQVMPNEEKRHGK